jgi:CHASE3 domain sensor protein
MTPEQFEALEEVIEEVELARIEQETAPQRVRLQRARDLLDEFLKASEEVSTATDEAAASGKEERLSLSQSVSRLVPLLTNLLP